MRGRVPHAYWGWSIEIQPLIAFVLCSNAGRFLSLDAWIERRRSGAPPLPASEWIGPAWPMRLVQVHTAALYLGSGGSRLADPGWYGGPE